MPYTVPAGAFFLKIDLYGAGSGGCWNGGFDWCNRLMRLGGHISASLTVTPGQVLYVTVGGQGGTNYGMGGSATGGFNGGGAVPPSVYGGAGGGGATDIRSKSSCELSSRVMVAGGAGGQGCDFEGGGGGGSVGQNGGLYANLEEGNGCPGFGGTQGAGGQGCGSAGSLGYGGDGITAYRLGASVSGGGGGGGYYGGSGGLLDFGGGGGSSYCGAGCSSVATNSQNVQFGSGLAVISVLSLPTASPTPAPVAAFCLPGSSSSTGREPCFLCSSGYFAPSAGLLSCTIAPAGSYPSTAANSGVPSSTGAGGITACPAGTFAPAPGSSFCTSCGAGYYAPTTGQSDCTQVSQGNFASSNGIAVGSGATGFSPCGPGTYAPSVGSSSCSPCQSSVLYGQTSCVSAPAPQPSDTNTDPTLSPTTSPTAAPLGLSATLTFSGLTQAVIKGDVDGSINSAVQFSVASALGILTQVATGQAKVGAPVWTFAGSFSTLDSAEIARKERQLLAIAQGTVSIYASPADLAGGSSTAAVASTLTSAVASITGAVQASTAVANAGISVTAIGASVAVDGNAVPTPGPSLAVGGSRAGSGSSRGGFDSTVIGIVVGVIAGVGLFMAVYHLYRKHKSAQEKEAEAGFKSALAYSTTSQAADAEVWRDAGSPHGDCQDASAVMVDVSSPPGIDSSGSSGPSFGAPALATPVVSLDAAWSAGLAEVSCGAQGPASAAAEALIPGLLSIAREFPLVGPFAGVLLKLYRTLKQVEVNSACFDALKEQADLGLSWLQDIAPRLRSGEVDSALVELALRRVVSSVNHAADVIALISRRYEHSQHGILGSLYASLASAALSSVDRDKLAGALTWLKEAIAYLLQTIPTVISLQVNVKLDGVREDVSAIMTMMKEYSRDKTQASERARRLQELTLQPDDIKLNAVIGEGGFSVVYSGLFHSKQVAVKVIRRKGSLKLSAREKQAIENELIVTRYLQDPNILTCYGFVHEPNRTLMVLEFAPYGSLWELLHDEDTLPSETVWADSSDAAEAAAEARDALPFSLCIGWLKDLCCAAAHMYTRGVKHKDIKAENLLVYAYPDRLVAKLCDFGFARQSSATMSLAGGGTANFEAPEVRATGKASFASDVFSCGMTAVQILTRQTPGRHDWQDQVVAAMAICSAGPAHASLQALLLRMVEADQLQRPNAIECASAVSSVMDSLGGDPRTDRQAPDFSLLEKIEDNVKSSRRTRVPVPLSSESTSLHQC